MNVNFWQSLLDVSLSVAVLLTLGWLVRRCRPKDSGAETDGSNRGDYGNGNEPRQTPRQEPRQEPRQKPRRSMWD